MKPEFQTVGGEGCFYLYLDGKYLTEDGRFCHTAGHGQNPRTFPSRDEALGWIEAHPILTVEEAIAADRIQVPCFIKASSETSGAAEALADALSEECLVVKVHRFGSGNADDSGRDGNGVRLISVSFPETISLPAIDVPVFPSGTVALQEADLEQSIEPRTLERCFVFLSFLQGLDIPEKELYRKTGLSRAGLHLAVANLTFCTKIGLWADEELADLWNYGKPNRDEDFPESLDLEICAPTSPSDAGRWKIHPTVGGTLGFPTEEAARDHQRDWRRLIKTILEDLVAYDAESTCNGELWRCLSHRKNRDDLYRIAQGIAAQLQAELDKLKKGVDNHK